MLELYHHGSSVCAAKVRLVLAEKGLGWTGHYLDILKGEQFTPEYLALNPKGVVPTLIDEGVVIRESTVICEYLDEVFPDPPLMPADAAGRARVRIWTKRVDEEVHPACSPVTFCSSHRHTVLRGTPAEVEALINQKPDPVAREKKRGWIYRGFEAPDAAAAIRAYDKALADMEAALASAPWISGADYGLADVALTPYVNRLAMLGMEEMWTRSRPRLTEWFARVRARPSFRPAMLDPVPTALAADLGANGRQSWPQVRAVLDAA